MPPGIPGTVCRHPLMAPEKEGFVWYEKHEKYGGMPIFASLPPDHPLCRPLWKVCNGNLFSHRPADKS